MNLDSIFVSQEKPRKPTENVCMNESSRQTILWPDFFFLFLSLRVQKVCQQFLEVACRMIHSQNTLNTLPYTTMDLIEIQHFLFQRRHKKLDFPIKMKGNPFHYSWVGFLSSYAVIIFYRTTVEDSRWILRLAHYVKRKYISFYKNIFNSIFRQVNQDAREIWNFSSYGDHPDPDPNVSWIHTWMKFNVFVTLIYL